MLVSTWFSHVEARWDFPGFAHYLRRLSSFSRLISFDKRGIGLSDPVPLDRLPLLEEWMDDVRTVMDAAGSERAVVMGANEGALMAALFAATSPERVSALVLANATARPAWAPDSRRDALFRAESGRAMAELIPGARFVEVPGSDYGLALGDVDVVIDEVEEFVTGSRPTHDVERVLATVLFTDIVGSTNRAVELGDRAWRTCSMRTRRSRGARWPHTAV